MDGSYCMNGSMGGSTMISCISSDVAVVTSCNIELSSILPKGFGESAVCYEPTPDSGQAVCAFNGTGYYSDGRSCPVLETALCGNVNPFADEKDHPISKRSADKLIDRLPKLVSILLSPVATITPVQIDEDVVKRFLSITSTLRCSNPFSTQGFPPVQSTDTSTSPPTGAMTFLPTMQTLKTPSLKAFHMAQETTDKTVDKGTDRAITPADPTVTSAATPELTTTSHATTTTYNGTTTITRVVSVLGNASTTTVVLTSTDYAPSSLSTSSVDTSFVLNNAACAFSRLYSKSNSTESITRKLSLLFALCYYAWNEIYAET
ncbi:hypothetical protein PHISCL_07767 [Aspergillus sclerotialis]|uniref:Uncharacterized protein n=1 Tax=Aspergillus sclerotialis TaxID=2070753 RepID=A0A3A2Z9U2_9EURO|nr:hypothetical protein PHISCL_07767 [Aspergillus sclerotialis]